MRLTDQHKLQTIAVQHGINTDSSFGSVIPPSLPEFQFRL